MAAQTHNTLPKKPLGQAVVIAAVSATALMEAPPFYFGGYNVIDYAAYGGLIISVPQLLSWGFNKAAQKLDIWAAVINSGLKGDASWATYKDLYSSLLHPSFFKTGHGSYWGELEGKPLFVDPPAVTTVIGTTGSGKDTTHLLIDAMSTKGSKLFLDFKTDLAEILAEYLRGQGEIVHIFDVDSKSPKHLDASATYNPLDLLLDNFERKGGLLDVMSDLTENAYALYPEPKSEGGNSNKFFRDGSRGLIKSAMVMTVLIEGRAANISMVLALLQDREKLLHYAQWAAGRLEVNTPDSLTSSQTLEAANDESL